MAKTTELPTAEKLGKKTSAAKTTAPTTTTKPTSGVVYVPKPGIYPKTKAAPDGYPGGFCEAVIDLLKASKGGLTEAQVRENLLKMQDLDGKLVPKSRKLATREETMGVIRDRTAHFLARWATPKA
mgnify:CR=1 FL=1